MNSFCAVTSTSAKTSPVRKYFLRRGLFVSVALTIGISAIPLYHAQAKAQRESELMQRSIRHCTALLNSCETLTFARNWRSTAKTDLKIQKGWGVDCRAGKRELTLLFDETTLQLCGVFYNDSQAPTLKRTTDLKLTNETQATEESLLRLQRLEMLRDGTEIALRAKPTKTLNGEAWRVDWKVRRKATGEVRLLNTVMDAAEGMPVMIYEPLSVEERKNR